MISGDACSREGDRSAIGEEDSRGRTAGYEAPIRWHAAVINWRSSMKGRDGAREGTHPHHGDNPPSKPTATASLLASPFAADTPRSRLCASCSGPAELSSEAREGERQPWQREDVPQPPPRRHEHGSPDDSRWRAPLKSFDPTSDDDRRRPASGGGGDAIPRAQAGRPSAHRRPRSGSSSSALRPSARQTGRGSGVFNPCNQSMFNGLTTSASGSFPLSRRGNRCGEAAGGLPLGNVDGGGSAPDAIYHRYNRPGAVAVRDYRCRMAQTTGVDPAAVRDRERVARKSSGYRCVEVEGRQPQGPEVGGAAWETEPVGPRHVSVGQRLCWKEPPKAPTAVATAANPFLAGRGRWTWTREEDRQGRAGDDDSVSPVSRDYPRRRERGSERRGRSPRRVDRPVGVEELRARGADPRAIMEAALAARFGFDAVSIEPSVIVPSFYRRRRGTSSPCPAPSPPSPVSLAEAEGPVAGGGSAPRQRGTGNSNTHRSAAGEVRCSSREGAAPPYAPRDPAALSSTLPQREQERQQVEEQQCLLLFSPMLTPLLEEVNQCLYEHGLGSVLQIWRASRTEQERVLTSVGFTRREREIILWELTRMVRNTSTTCTVAI